MLLEQPAPAQSPVLHPTALHSSPPLLPHKAAEQHSWSLRDLHQGFQFLAKELHARARAAKMHRMHELRHHCWGMGWVWSQKTDKKEEEEVLELHRGEHRSPISVVWGQDSS